MQDRHVSNKTDAAQATNIDNKKLTLQELSEDKISMISGGAGAGAGINSRVSLTFNHNETMVSAVR